MLVTTRSRRARWPAALASLVALSCGSTSGGVPDLSDRIGTAANRMTLLSQASRTVTYVHFRDDAYRLAFVPAGTSPAALAAAGISLGPQAVGGGCLSSHEATIIVADGLGTQCVTHDRVSMPSLMVVKKGAGAETAITLKADASGLRVEAVE